MAECIDIQAELSAYLDGELTAQERTALDAHLSTCDACRAMLQELRGVTSTVSDLPRVKAPVSLMTNLRRDIANEPALREQVKAAATFTSVAGGARPRTHWAPFVFGMAAMVLLCLLAFLILPAISKHTDSVALETPPAARAATPAPSVAQPESLKQLKDAAPAANAAERSKPADAEAKVLAIEEAEATDRAKQAPGAPRARAERKASNGSVAAQPPAPFAQEPAAPPAGKADDTRAEANKLREAATGDVENRALRRSVKPQEQKLGAPGEQPANAPKQELAFGADGKNRNGEEVAAKAKSNALPLEDKDRAAEYRKRPEEKATTFKADKLDAGPAGAKSADLQQRQQKEAEALAGGRLEEAKEKSAGLAKKVETEKGVPPAPTSASRGASKDKDEKFDQQLQNRDATLKSEVAQGGGAGKGGGAAPGAAAPAKKSASDAPTAGAAPAPAPVAPPPIAAPKPIPALAAAESATPNRLVIRTKDPQRAIRELKQLVEASGGRWEDVAFDGRADKPFAEKKKTAADEGNTALNFQAVTSADQRENLLARLRSYDVALRQNAGPAIGAVTADPAAPAVADKNLFKAEKRREQEGGAGNANAVDTKQSPPAKPAATVAPPADAAKREAQDERIQIVIEIIPE